MMETDWSSYRRANFSSILRDFFNCKRFQFIGEAETSINNYSLRTINNYSPSTIEKVLLGLGMGENPSFHGSRKNKGKEMVY